MGDEEVQRWSRPLQKWDFVVLGLNVLSGAAEAVSETLQTLQVLVAAHANHKNDQRIFHQEAAIQIERLTGDE